MPIYEFHCRDCNKDFELLCSFKADLTKITCEICHGTKVAKKISNFSTAGSTKSFDLGSGGAEGGHSHGGGCGSCSTHNCGSCGH